MRYLADPPEQTSNPCPCHWQASEIVPESRRMPSAIIRAGAASSLIQSFCGLVHFFLQKLESTPNLELHSLPKHLRAPKYHSLSLPRKVLHRLKTSRLLNQHCKAKPAVISSSQQPDGQPSRLVELIPEIMDLVITKVCAP